MCDSGPLWNHNDVHRRQSIGVGGGFITAFLIAMQESREDQATREIRRHQRLVREAEAYQSGRLAQHETDPLRPGEARVGRIDRAPAQQSEGWAGIALRALLSRFRDLKTKTA